MKKIFFVILVIFCSGSIYGIKKRAWRIDEFNKLNDLVESSIVEKGSIDWSFVSKSISEFFGHTRTPRQCREKYRIYIKTKSDNLWTTEDDIKLIFLQSQYGNKWAYIANFFENKNCVCLKNRYAKIMRNKMKIERSKIYCDFILYYNNSEINTNKEIGTNKVEDTCADDIDIFKELD